MAPKRQRIEVPEDNYGRLYIGMLETPISSAAKLVYGVMWSFGKESWASLQSIARRASLSKPTVVKAQVELQGAGWITLIEKGSVHETNWWRMNPPAVNIVKFRGKATLPLEVKPLVTKQEGNQELKKESDTADADKEAKKAKGLAIGALLGTFKKIWELEFKEPYKTNAQDGKAADRLVKLNVTPETVEAKALQFVKSADPWIRARGHAFWVLEWKWVEFRAVKPQGNKPEFEG